MTFLTGLRVPAAAIAMACTLMVTTPAGAATISVSTETGVAQETEFGIRTDTGTRGYEMAGATVTARFIDGSSETAVWTRDPNAQAANGIANGNNWGFIQNAVGLTNIISNGRTMTGFTMDTSTSISATTDFGTPPTFALQGASLFDATIADELLGSTESTPGSSFGTPFEFRFNPPMGNVAVTYSGAVNLTGQAAFNDLFTTMTVDFTGLVGGGFTGSSNYFTDMDTLLVAGDLIPVAPVPLPAGLPLLLAGLGGLGLLRRKTR